MRRVHDVDMVDVNVNVNVTSPEIWARERNVAYEDVLVREDNHEAMVVMNMDQGRPRTRGGHLTAS